LNSIRPEPVEGLVLIPVHPSTSSGRTERKPSEATGEEQYNSLKKLDGPQNVRILVIGIYLGFGAWRSVLILSSGKHDDEVNVVAVLNGFHELIRVRGGMIDINLDDVE